MPTCLALDSSNSAALGALFCINPFTSESDFQTFITAFKGYIAAPGTLTAEEKAYLDFDDDNVVTIYDLEFWLAYLLRQRIERPGGRLPVSWQGGGDPPSDPLGLTVGRTDTVLLVDAQNASSVRVQRGTNDVYNQSGVLQGVLFSPGTPNTYNYTLFETLEFLDETNFGSVSFPSSIPRRFPNQTGRNIDILVRGDTYVHTKEIHVRHNEGGDYPDSIRIRAYPGEVVTLNFGSSQIQLGEPHDGYAGKYRFLYAFTLDRGQCFLEYIDFVGYRGSSPNRIFAHKLFRTNPPDLLGGTRITKCSFLDTRGIAPDSPDAAAYPNFVDSQYYTRVRTDNTAIYLSLTDLATPGAGSFTLTSVAGGFTPAMVGAYIRITSNTNNFVPGFYRIITRVNNNEVTLGSAVGESSPTPSGAGSSGVGYVGGTDPSGYGDTPGEILVTLHLAHANCALLYSHVRHHSHLGPPLPSTWFGDGAFSVDTGIIISHNKFDGACPHFQISLAGSTNTVSYNDISNLDHGCITLGGGGNGSTITRNRCHTYGQQSAAEHSCIQLLGSSSNTITENVIYNHGIESPGWGIALAATAGSGLSTSNNVVTNNILYRTSVRLFYTGGTLGTNQIQNNTVNQNVIVDLPDYNRTAVGYRAPVAIYVDNWPNGNTIQSNTIRRLDAEPWMLVQLNVGGTDTRYDIDDVLANYTSNNSNDPLFSDPENGNFALLAGSPVSSLFTAETPLVSLPDPATSPEQVCVIKSGDRRFPRGVIRGNLRGSS